MKRILFICLLLTVIFIKVPSVEAKAPDFNGGVLNEYTYEEVFFLQGTPITFTGKPVVTEKQTKDKMTSTYKFTLRSSRGDTLTRSVSYESDITNFADKGQTTSKGIVKSYSEKISLFTGQEYTLDDYQFSQGTVTDNRPAADYYSSNIVGRKIYKIKADKSKPEELITVSLSGRNMGYKNFWGATETQIIDYEIESNLPNKPRAFVTSKVSDSKSRTLQYEPNDPSLSSFTGGYVVTSSSNMLGEYTYNIPYGVGKGRHQINLDKSPLVERLIVPKFRDLAQHWAKDSIERLYSLGILDEQTPIFSPNTPLNRYQYTVGVLKAVDLRVADEPKNTTKKIAAKKAIFKDLNAKDKDYLYIESGVEKGVISGMGTGEFRPADPITRVQAVSILIRALGMEGRAPSPGYHTGFRDDTTIPRWAKDSVYVATQLDLVYGDQNNNFNPNKPITRAEGSALIVRFLDFLENDLKQNYRDDILFKN